jgi:K+-transporting ATPase ATPase C chain
MKTILNNLKIFLFFIFLTGIIYPLFITGISQGLFQNEANGSLIAKNGKIIGSALLAQEFKGKHYFWPRPSAANYDSSASAASNLSPDSLALSENIAKRALENNIDRKSNIDLLYSSGSGLDPHISPLSAENQIDRIAKARGLSEVKILELKKIVLINTEQRQFEVLGRTRINVLKLNLELDKKF